MAGIVRLAREDAIKPLHEWVQSESLRRHCFAVACAMEGYAEKYLKEDKLPENNDNKLSDNGMKNNNLLMEDNNKIVDNWWMCGLLHDFDYEKYPDINLHPKKGCEELEKLGYDKEIIEAIMGHNSATGVKRSSLMAKVLFAVDELCGLIVALSKVRPNGFEGMSAESVEKALKKKDFAAAISREDIEKGILELGADRKEHFNLVIKSLVAKFK